MKKIISFLFAFCFCTIYSYVWAQSNISIGYTFIPGSYYYLEGGGIFNNGTRTFSYSQQGKVESDIYLIPIRFSFTKQFNSLYLGLESGLDISFPTTMNEWNMPATYNFTGTTRYPDDTLGVGIPNSVNAKLQKDIDTWAIPLLVTVNSNIIKNKRTNAGIGLSLGEYILMQKVVSNQSFTWVRSAEGRSAGDVEFYAKQWTFITGAPIAELRFNLEYKLSEKFLLNISPRITYLPGFTLIFYDERLAKTEYQLGGIGYGLRLGINLDF